MSSCTSIKVPDVEVCAVAGRMAAGAECTTAISGTGRSLALDEFIKYLEPDPVTEKGAAIVMSSAGFTAYKTAFEQACAKLRNACKEPVMEQFNTITRNVEGLQRRVSRRVARD